MGAKQPPNRIFHKINMNNIDMLSKMGKPQNSLNLYSTSNKAIKHKVSGRNSLRRVVSSSPCMLSCDLAKR